MAGLYIHVPFCLSKCPYCDFYSLTDLSLADEYVSAVEKRLDEYGELSFSSLYFGGGTPSAVGADRIIRLINKAAARLSPQAEITVECNPSSVDADFFKSLACRGVNRISLGLQSASDSERRALGRLSGRREAGRAVQLARAAGIDNISLDLMLGIPGQSADTLNESLDFCLSAGVPHVSAYMLKIEPGTRFYEMKDDPCLPDEDAVCDLYLQAVQRLGQGGLAQYEISNFARPSYEGRHNLNYWSCGEYLGLGPAAHSFLAGKRFFFERDLHGFIGGGAPVPDGDGGDFTEYAMLRLRLCEGLRNDLTVRRFGHPIPEALFKRAEKYSGRGLLYTDAEGIRLTSGGFLLSNTIISDILL